MKQLYAEWLMGMQPVAYQLQDIVIIYVLQKECLSIS